MRRRFAGTAALLVLFALAGSGAASAFTGAASGAVAGHAPITDRLRTGAGTATSTNWSGYAAYGATFTDVKGDWQQPTADCSGLRRNQVSLAAFWVGLDGYQSKTVEQTGTEADCVGTSPVYYAWYEFYPARLVVLDSGAYPVNHGDAVHAEVAQTTLTLTDTTAGWTFTTPVPASKFAFSSAEWIAEGPTKTLANFGSAGFSSATASDNSVTDDPIDSTAWSNDAITMVANRGPHAAVRALPSTLSGGSAFTINWQHL